MADYISYVRSNYFKVKDISAFEDFCCKYDLALIEDTDQDTGQRLVGFVQRDGLNTGIPTGYYDDETDKWVDSDFIAELASHLADGYVAEVREVGYEKMCYLVGVTIAVNHGGEAIIIALDDIYSQVQRKWGAGHTITACQY